jgi:energy-coupling factor transporter ATP-binding protein EcfA2
VSTAGEVYAERRRRCLADERRLAEVSLRISIARGITFAAFLICLLLILLSASSSAQGGGGWSTSRRWAPWGAGLTLGAFAALALVHDRRLRQERRIAELRRINEEGLARLDRDWDRLPLLAEPPRDHGLPLARDLDLYGRASLFQLLGTAHTPAAKGLLRDWLDAAPAGLPAELRRRQAAVEELAAKIDFRQLLELELRGMERHPPDCEPFLTWAEGEPWLLERRWLLWSGRLLTTLTVGMAVASLVLERLLPPLLPLLIVNLGLSYALAGRLSPRLERVSARRDEMMRYVAALRHVAAESGAAASPCLRQLEQELTTAGRPAYASLALLENRLGLADARHAAPVHFGLQALLLWDLHILALLETWQRGDGRKARRWLGALGEIEALSALAALRFENPAWCFPDFAAPEEMPGDGAERPADDAESVRGALSDRSDRIVARSLGHPLLPPAQCVGNDVTVGPPGTFLLVTGSNMSGKSTLLRALGLNVVLAQAGGPVCAAELRLPPLRLATSILVEDSLASGVSFFLAELLRIKTVVGAAEDARRQGLTLFYLLDEVLRGTNSVERQIAVRRIVRHLLTAGALGAVSTHDLGLADGAGLAGNARPVHFRETLAAGATPEGGPRMTFDYLLRPGPATTTNALELLRQVGLDFAPGEDA